MPTSSVDSPAAPIIQTTFSSNGRIYAMRAFLLDHQPKGRDSVVAVLLEQISPNRVDFPKAQRLFGLSRREIEAIQVLLFGKTDKEIASTLELSHETVRTYLKTIRAKLGVSTRTAILHKLLLH